MKPFFHSARQTQAIIFILLVIILIFCLVYRQPIFPAPWFDEGLNISAAAQIATQGVYALPDSEGARVLDPAIQTGPPVLLPIALAFRLWGVELLVARMVMIAFAIMTFFAYFWASKTLLPLPGAILAAFFLVIGNREESASFLYSSRQVLGEVPALGFLLLGLSFWWKTREKGNYSWVWALLAGFSWGLACITKSQVMLLFPISLISLAVLDFFYYRQTPIKLYFLALITITSCVAVWYLAQYIISGPERFAENSIILRQGLQRHVLGLNWHHWKNALRVIWSSGWLAWGAPGFIWGIWMAKDRSSRGYAWASLILFPLIVLGWFIVFSIGWGRYAFFIFAYAPILLAGLALFAWDRAKRWRLTLRTAGFSTLILIYSLVSGGNFFDQLIHAQGNGFAPLIHYMQTSLPPDVLVESWAWEVDPFVPQAIHHPTTDITNAYTAKIFSGEPIPEDLYEPLSKAPDYILDGPFSNWTGIYYEVILNHGKQVAAFGQYTLYQVLP